MIVEGQIHGGVAQGIGGALYEKLCYDAAGQPLTRTFMEFHIPTATEVPSIDVVHLETLSPLNPLGVKGVRSEEHTSELQSRLHLVCRLLLENKCITYNMPL